MKNILHAFRYFKDGDIVTYCGTRTAPEKGTPNFRLVTCKKCLKKIVSPNPKLRK